MKQQLINAARIAINSSTEDYGGAFKSIAYNACRVFALLFTAGLMTGEYIRSYWQSFQQWADGWAGDPFTVEPQPVLAVAAPAAPPVKPPAPPAPAPAAKSRKRSAKNANRTTPQGFAM